MYKNLTKTKGKGSKGGVVSKVISRITTAIKKYLMHIISTHYTPLQSNQIKWLKNILHSSYSIPLVPQKKFYLQLRFNTFLCFNTKHVSNNTAHINFNINQHFADAAKFDTLWVLKKFLFILFVSQVHCFEETK